MWRKDKFSTTKGVDPKFQFKSKENQPRKKYPITTIHDTQIQRPLSDRTFRHPPTKNRKFPIRTFTTLAPTSLTPNALLSKWFSCYSTLVSADLIVYKAM